MLESVGLVVAVGGGLALGRLAQAVAAGVVAVGVAVAGVVGGIEEAVEAIVAVVYVGGGQTGF